MNARKPNVSVIIPTYNRSHLISRAIQSVLDQTYQDFEIIVSDDASTDNTEEMVKGFNDERIRYFRHSLNKGGGATRNIGIKAARGEYIAFLDDDDEWLGDKLKKQIEAMKDLPPEIWGGIYCGFYYIIDGKVTTVRAALKGNFKKEILNKEIMIGASSSTLLFSREAIEETGLFDETFERHQDWEYLIRFFRKYKLYSLDEPLVKAYGRLNNIPDGEMMARVKENYLSKFKEDIYEYGNEAGKEIFAKNWLEVAFVFAKEGEVKKCLHYSKKSLAYKILPLRWYSFIPLLIFRILINRKRVGK
jgi:glycosyltransferase involved in cell wall biosynthesis